MKRIIKILFCTILLGSLLVAPCSAIESNVDTYSEEFDYGAILDGVDDETLEILNEIGINEISFNEIFSVEAGKIFDALFNIVSDSVKEPLRFFVIAVGIMLISSLISSFNQSEETVSVIGCSALSVCIAVPFAELLTTSFSVLQAIGVFITCFSGVFCAIVSSAGQVYASVSYSAFSVFSNNIFSVILSEIGQPMISAICSLGFLSCFDMFSFVSRFTDIIRKVYVYVLSFIGTVFSGIVTLKGVLSEGADSLTSRSIRFVVGRSLPVVGGSVSETYSTLISSLNLIKNTVGVFGIITVTVIVMPVVINLLAWLLVFEAIISVAEAFGEKIASGMLIVFKNAVILLLATIAIVTSIMIVSIGVVIAVKGGGI